MKQPVYVAMAIAMNGQHYAGHSAIHGAWASKEEALAALRVDRHARFLGSDFVLYECLGVNKTEIEWQEAVLA